MIPKLPMEAEGCGNSDPHEREVTKETVVCPEMVFGGRKVKRPTMRVSECETRRRYNRTCRKCKVKLPPAP